MAQCTTIGDEMVQAADHGLLVLGEIVREAIYERIERTHQVKREEIPEKLPTFHQALQDLIGGGAKVMEKLIAPLQAPQIELYGTSQLDNSRLCEPRKGVRET